MVHIKAYRGSEIRRFEVDSGTTFAQLNEMVIKLFELTEDDTVTLSYCDREGDVVRLSSDGELQTALKHLGEDDTWKLQVTLSHKNHSHSDHPHHRVQVYQPVTSWWDWNPFYVHHSIREPFRGDPMNSLFGQSLWDDDPFGVDQLWEHQRRLLNQQKKKAEMARRNAMRQASVDAKRAADEMQTQSEVKDSEQKKKAEVAHHNTRRKAVKRPAGEANPGEVANKKSKVVYEHFGSWEPKVEKGDNYVITTYGPVGYRVHYGHEDDADNSTNKQTEEEETKME